MGFSLAGRRVSVLTVALVLLTLEAAAAALLMYGRLRAAVEAEIGRRAMGVAVAAAQGIDPREYARLMATGNLQDPFFQKMQARFQELRANQGAAFVYSEQRTGPTTVRYIIDADPPGGPQRPGAMEEDVMDATSARAHATGTPLYGPLTRHPVWGELITGYAPILDAQGQVLGVVGVDFRREATAPILGDLAALAATAAAAGTALGWWLGRRRAGAGADMVLWGENGGQQEGQP